MTGPDTLVGGRYRLIRRLAAGGMGSVWEAMDERLNRPVALKQLHVQPGLSPEAAELASSRAMREARITARLHHPNAVPVYDVVDENGLPCLIMQYLPSTNLAALLKERGTLAPSQVARIGSEVASALAAAHELGIVHRDVKPGNVLIADDGTAKVTDFGVSHALGDVSLTSTGLVTGTPAFLAPEVARGADTAYSADVFGLGATLYDALEGQPPFGRDDNPMAMLHRAASGQIIPPQRSGPLTSLLLRMLATDPQARPSMLDVSRTLGALAADINAVTPLTQGRPAFDPLLLDQNGTTERIAPPIVPVGPPTSTLDVIAPASSDWIESERRPNRAGPIAALVVLALVIAGLIGLLLLRNHHSNNIAGPTTSGGVSAPTSSHSVSKSASKAATTTSKSVTSASAPSTPPSSNRVSTSAATSNPPSTTKSTSNPPAPTGPTDGQLAQAITDYYGLLPANTDQAWNELTKNYQHTTAKNRKTYDDFWASVDSVQVSGVSGSAPSSAQATVTFHFKDGKVETDQTSFGLVQEGGVLKIDSSSVQNSQTQ